MAQCKECRRDFMENRPFQVFCDSRCKGAYHRRKYREQAREQAVQRQLNRVVEDGSLAELAEKVKEALANIQIDIPANATRAKHKCQGCDRYTTNERFCSPGCRLKLFEKYENAQPMKLVRRI